MRSTYPVCGPDRLSGNIGVPSASNNTVTLAAGAGKPPVVLAGFVVTAAGASKLPVMLAGIV
jgi:hypothetical protein